MPKLRKFTAERLDWQSFPGKAIAIAQAVAKEDGGDLSAYFARLGKNETADLPVPYAEIWVVMSGALTLHSGGETFTAGAGEVLHVPADTPGEVVVEADTELVCVSVPAH